MENKELTKMPESDGFEYVGFSTRMLGATIDLCIITLLITPIVNLFIYVFYEGKTPEIMISDFFSVERQGASTWDFFIYLIDSFKTEFIVIQLITFLLISMILLWFWKKYNATIGKMIMRCRIIDDKTGQAPSQKQYILRLIGYIISCIPPFIGFFMMSLNKKSRGLHDYIAGTSVVYIEKSNSATKQRRKFFLW